MTLPRTYLPGPFKPGPVKLTAAQAGRLVGSRRLREGSEFLAFPGDGTEWSATVLSVSNGKTTAELIEVVREEPPSPLTLELFCGLVRPSRFEWAIEKCVEAGADVIRPLLSENSARGSEPSGERLERWERIVIEAAEQSGRLRLAIIGGPAHFDTIVTERTSSLVVCDGDGEPWRRLAARVPGQGSLRILIGPEGGLSQDELARARAAGATIASLGPHVMRTETAALAATVLVRSASAQP